MHVVVDAKAADGADDHRNRRMGRAEVRVWGLHSLLVDVLLAAVRAVLRPAIPEQHPDGRGGYRPGLIAAMRQRLVHDKRAGTGVRRLYRGAVLALGLLNRRLYAILLLSDEHRRAA